MKHLRVIVMTFCFMLLLSITAFAQEYSLDGVDIGIDDNYVIYQFNDSGDVYVCVGETSGTINVENKLVFDSGTVYLWNGECFVWSSAGKVSIMTNYIEFLNSNFDIMNSDGSVFFSLPKPHPTEMILPTILEQMGILVGVGILLISLMLLPNLLRRLLAHL